MTGNLWKNIVPVSPHWCDNSDSLYLQFSLSRDVHERVDLITYCCVTRPNTSSRLLTSANAIQRVQISQGDANVYIVYN